MQIYKIIGDIKGKNILLLQGPMGNFFNILDQKFTRAGANTFRIGLNAGDQFFADARHFTPFAGYFEEWHDFIKEFYKQHSIDMIFVFGDCRVYQKEAISVAKEDGIRVFVFEEGYIRPDFITLEENGANFHSSLPRERSFYDPLEYHEHKECNFKRVKHIGSTYGRMAWYAIRYYIFANLFSYKYPHYKHHRDFSSINEAMYGVKNFYRKQLYRVLEFGQKKQYESSLAKKYYFVALQTFEDFQMKVHSDFNSVEEFIMDVLDSFKKNTSADKYLVIKHHPMDRGKKDYKHMILSYAKQLGCEERVKVVYDVHLPTLLKNAIGTITVNSTVGISSLYHHTPTICLGRSFYDIEGLTSKGMSLEQFWDNYKEVDQELFKKYRCYLIEKTQINGNFYLGKVNF